MWVSMLTVLLIKRRAQSPADAARDPPQGTARSHIDGTTKATPR